MGVSYPTVMAPLTTWLRSLGNALGSEGAVRNAHRASMAPRQAAAALDARLACIPTRTRAAA